MTKRCKHCRTRISFGDWFLYGGECTFCEDEKRERAIKKRSEERKRKEKIQKRDSKRYWDKQKEKK